MALTKEQVEEDFKEQYADVLKGTDKPAKRFAWQTYIDGLNKDGQITDNQVNNWGNPSFVK